MTGLLDVATSSQTVTANGIKVPVYGVSAQGIAWLFERFPGFMDVFTGKMQTDTFKTEDLFKLVPEAIGAIIVAGTGNMNNPEAEKVASNLPAGVQVEFIERILALTMPQGIRPFVEKLTGLLDSLNVESSATVPVSKSRKPLKA